MVSASSVVGRWRASGTLRPLLSGSAWFFLMQCVSKPSMLLTTVIAAQLLGVAEFGLFVSLQALVFVSISAWDLGVSQMLTRDVAAGEISVRGALRRAVSTRFWLFPLWLAVYSLGAMLVGSRTGEALVAGVIFALAALGSGISLNLDACLHGRLQFRSAALATATGRIVFAVAAISVGLLAPHAALAAMALTFLLGVLVTVAVQSLAVYWMPHRREWHRVDEEKPRWSTVAYLRRSLPLALNEFFGLVMGRLDVAIISVLVGATLAGLYAPASRIQDALLVFPMTGVAALVPIAARRYAADHGHAAGGHQLHVAIVLSLLLTVPPVVGVILFAQPIVDLAFGSQYEASVMPIRIVALSLPFIAITTPIISLLVASGRASTTTPVFLFSLVMMVGGLALLAPRWGATGAAWAAVVREAVVAGLCLLVLLKSRSQTAS